MRYQIFLKRYEKRKMELVVTINTNMHAAVAYAQGLHRGLFLLGCDVAVVVKNENGEVIYVRKDEKEPLRGPVYSMRELH